MKLTRVTTDPILVPRADVPWEKDAVFNCAVIHEKDTFHLYYRAVAHPNYSVIGHAWSSDGIHFERRGEPVIRREFPEESIGVEDPRVTKIGDTYYMLFTTWNERDIQVGMAVASDPFGPWTREGIVIPVDMMGHNKDAALFPGKVDGRYCVVHRPEPDILVSFSRDMRDWRDHRLVMKPRPNSWEEKKIGANGPPIRTAKGWLFPYHGVDNNMVYRLGIALLDLQDPSIVLKRQETPILEPELPWELQGDVPNVVFSCGAVLIGPELWVYYGGADKVIGLAKGDVTGFLAD